MSYDADLIVDRRRMRRKLTFWRVSATLLAAAVVIALAVFATPGGRRALTGRDAIARVTI